MPKILHVIAQVPGKTGSGTFLQSLVSKGGNKGYSQAVVAGISSNDTINSFLYTKEIKFYPVMFETTELPFSVVGMSDVMPYKSTRYKDLTAEMYEQWKCAFQKAVSDAVEEFKPDLIISHHLWILTSLTRRIIQNIPIIGICHGTDLRQLKSNPRFSSYVIEGCKCLDKVFALNYYQKNKIIEDFGINEDKVIVTGTGYNSDVFFPNINKTLSNKIKIVYAGKLSYSKGVVSLLNAFGKLNCANNLNLILVGSGSRNEEKIIQNMAKRIGPSVVLTGAVSQNELAEIFRQSDVFVLPSFYEGMPLVLIEALASGLRAVCTELPGVKDHLDYEINSSGIIEYVKLPRLINIDRPVQDDVVAFEERLKIALEKQITFIQHGKHYWQGDIYRKIRDMAWDEVYNKMETFFWKTG